MAIPRPALIPCIDASSPSEPAAQSGVRARPLPELAPGTHVDRLEIVRLLGRGGMGCVYQALDTKLQRHVAVKLVRPELLGSPIARERFLEEARTAARFDHPNIVPVFMVGETDAGSWPLAAPYVAMAFVQGRTLRERLSGPGGTVALPTLREALRIGLGVARALVAAHRAHVCHCDLKPSNVMLSGTTARVLDFGLAQAGWHAARHEGETGQPVGTPGYMAPEQWRGRACTGAADVWALGVMLFEMLAGFRPFLAGTRAEQAMAVCSAEPATRLEALASVPRSLARLVARCLDKDSARRPTAAAVVRVLRALLVAERNRLVEPVFRARAPFDERHAGLFFGREVEVAELRRRLRERATVALVGSAGVGKTSLVRAGLVPALCAHDATRVLHLRPGGRPLRALAALLVENCGGGEQLEVSAVEQRLWQTPGLALLALRDFADRTGRPVLLVVDPLDELFVRASAREARKLVSAVLGRIEAPGVGVLLVGRDGLLAQPSPSIELSACLRDAMALGPLAAGELERALCEPVHAVGLRWDDEQLPRELARALEGEELGAALAQELAATLWGAPGRGQRRALARMGGIDGAIAAHAERVLDGLSVEQRSVARLAVELLVGPRGDLRRMDVEAVLGACERAGMDGAAQVVAQLVEARVLGLGAGKLSLAVAALAGRSATVRRWSRFRHELAQKVPASAMPPGARLGARATELSSVPGVRTSR